MKKKLILVGAGETGKEALLKYGSDKVAYFCDNNRAEGDKFCGVPLIDLDRLGKIHQLYDVVITITKWQLLVDVRLQLERASIPYKMYGKNYSICKPSMYRMSETLHIYSGGVADGIRADYCWSSAWYYFEYKANIMMHIIETAINKYSQEFKGRKIDFYLCLEDSPFVADMMRREMGIARIFSFSTVDLLSDRVIAFPDYRSFISDEQYPFGETPQKCKAASNKPWSDRRAVWRGSRIKNHARHILYLLAHRHPECLAVHCTDEPEKASYVPVTEQTNHKYFIDVEGIAWTDRLKVLLQLGRPIFLVWRQYKEWYFKHLRAWEHYIPVEPDLSDLIEKYKYMESHDELYNLIVKNTRQFSEQWLTTDAYLLCAKELIFKYGTY